MNSSSVSNRITIGTNECTHNVFIKALNVGGILNHHKEKGPYEALLVPQQSSLLSCGLDTFLRMSPPAASEDTVSSFSESPTRIAEILEQNSPLGSIFNFNMASSSAILDPADGKASAKNASLHPEDDMTKETLQADSCSLLKGMQKVLCEFVLFHLIHFDSSGNSRFTTAKGHRGEFSDALDAVKRFGRLGVVPVLSDMNPLFTLSDYSLNPYHPLKLHMYIIDRPLMDEQELANLNHSLQRVARPPRTKVPTEGLHSLPLSSLSLPFAGEKLGKSATLNFNAQPDCTLPLDDVVVETDLMPYASKSSREQTHSVFSQHMKLFTHKYSKESIMNYKKIVAEDNEIFYSEFEHLMSKPICSELVRLVTGFLLEVHRKTAPSKIDRIYNRFMDNTCEMVEKICSTGNDTRRFMILREGLEKFVMSKLYQRVFNTNPVDLHKNKVLQGKLKRASTISAPQLDALLEVEQHYLWGQTMFELDGMNFFKSPRDKLRCAMRASELLSLIIGNVLLTRQSDSPPPLPRLSEANEAKTGEESVQSGMPSFGADVFLPCFMLLVLRAQPCNYGANVCYIDTYRGLALCSSEERYVLSNLNASVEFWMAYDTADDAEAGDPNGEGPSSFFDEDAGLSTSSGVVLRRLMERCLQPSMLHEENLLPSLRQTSTLLHPTTTGTSFRMESLSNDAQPCLSTAVSSSLPANPTPSSGPLVEKPFWRPFRFFSSHETPTSGGEDPPAKPAESSPSGIVHLKDAPMGAIRDLLVVQNKVFDQLTLSELRTIVEEAREMARRWD
ncbi:unnamed protein product [Phytomonas sp. Hart1]|nr:unnamed protein product [Phytomonas sp. Hart1]|eukprot:CCW69893.1 unnamed protein product [Phytomonas sp. isolate Hart1]